MPLNPLQHSVYTSLLLCSSTLSKHARASFEARLTGGLYAAITVAQFGLLVLEEVPKRDQNAGSTLGEELRRGFWARAFFYLVNPVLRLGFQKSLLSDQLPNLGPEFVSRIMAERFEKKWVKSEWPILPARGHSFR